MEHVLASVYDCEVVPSQKDGLQDSDPPRTGASFSVRYAILQRKLALMIHSKKIKNDVSGQLGHIFRDCILQTIFE